MITSFLQLLFQLFADFQSLLFYLLSQPRNHKKSNDTVQNMHTLCSALLWNSALFHSNHIKIRTLNFLHILFTFIVSSLLFLLNCPHSKDLCVFLEDSQSFQHFKKKKTDQRYGEQRFRTEKQDCRKHEQYKKKENTQWQGKNIRDNKGKNTG